MIALNTLNKFSLNALFTILLMISLIGCGVVENGKTEKHQETSVDSYDITTNTTETNEKDFDSHSVYEQYLSEIGEENTNKLYEQLGQAQMDLISYGSGASIVVSLVNAVSDVNKLIALIGNDHANSGLGAVRIIGMLKFVQAEMKTNTYKGAPPVNQDTVGILATLVNGLSQSDLMDNVVGLIKAMGISKNMKKDSDIINLTKICQLVAHTNDPYKLVTILSDMEANEVSSKLKDLMLGINDIEKMVAVVDGTTSSSKLVALIKGIEDTSKLITILNEVSLENASKVSTLADHVTNPVALVEMINLTADASKVAALMNEVEDGTQWDGQVGAPQVWSGVITPGNGVDRLIQVINDLSSGTPAETVANMTKLQHVLDNISDVTKMMRVIQDVSNVNDMVTIMQILPDPAVNKVPSQNLGILLNDLSLNNIPRMVLTIDGQRVPGKTGDQAVYLSKLTQMVMELDQSMESTVKVALLVDRVTETEKMIDTIYGIKNPSHMATIINEMDKPSTPWPGDNSVNTLAYLINQFADTTRLVDLTNTAKASNLALLIREIGKGSQWSDSQIVHEQDTVDDRNAGGEKMHILMRDVTDMNKFACYIDTGDANQTAAIVNTLKIEDMQKLVLLMNTVPCQDLVAIANVVVNTDALIQFIVDVQNTEKLTTLINAIANVEYLSALINTILADPNTGIEELAGLINKMALPDISKLAAMINLLHNTGTGVTSLDQITTLISCVSQKDFSAKCFNIAQI